MKKQQHALDQNEQYFVDFEYDEKNGLFSGGLRINPNAYHKDMRVEESLSGMMDVTLNGQKIRIKKRGAKQGYYNHFEFSVPQESFSDFKLLLRGQEFGKYKLNPSKDSEFFGDERSGNKLTAFEIRSLARADDVPEIPFSRQNTPKVYGKTDLHTHFAAIVGSKDLLQAGFDKEGDDIVYPVPFLEKLGISYDEEKVVDGEFGKGIPLRKENFTKEDVIKLQESMHIPVDKQATFNDLERIYDYRIPITKTNAMFEPLAESAAKTYQRTGVKYAEPTFTKMVEPEWVDRINRCMPAIEKKYGVKMRFLAGMIRFMDEPTNMHRLEKLKKLAKSPYIAGVDYIGHEINSTKEFKTQLEDIAKWAKENDPNFIVRVHAGESSIHKDNIKDALKVAKKYGIKMRIGHGLYGVDEETIQLFKETGAIVEFNMHSNLALNNIDGISQLPIARYLNKGVNVVLASDGGGIYQSDAFQEALVARFAGVTNGGMKAIRNTERRYLNMQKDNMKVKEAKEGAYVVDYDQIPDATPFVNASRKLQAKKLAQTQAEYKKLENSLSFDEERREKLFKGKHPVFVSGAGTSMEALTKEEKREVYVALDVAMEYLDNKKVYFVTSGYKYGVEGLFHNLKKKKNKAPKILAVIAKSTKHKDTDCDAVDSAVFLGENKFDRSWHEVNYLKDKRGSAVFFGGGSITSDQIQTSVNYDLDYYLMTGVKGSSSYKAIYDKKHSCNGAEEFLKSFYKNNQNLFRENFDPEKINIYVNKSEKKIDRLLSFEDREVANLRLSKVVDGVAKSKSKVAKKADNTVLNMALLEAGKKRR
jgi:adenosine deaminase